ncbi:MAG: type II secretion system protein [Acidobacteria bacterium]|nr:type II secretion system protein [Acidobacteriota bacterium]MCW5948046.1 type II secretion system protein [Pyrinomonadaceae bacterium]
MTATVSNENCRESGMTLLAVMAVMALIAVALLAVAPSIQQEIQREKELEAIRRGEEVAEAIRQYVEFYRGSKLPNSLDDLLEGLPQDTKKRMILRASAAVDPLSDDGKWRLIRAEPRTLAAFAKRVQDYNRGLLPSNPSQTFDRYAIVIVNSLNTQAGESDDEPDDTDFESQTENAPFIGVASKSRAKSVIAYYGIENCSNWIFTPLFRGSGMSNNPATGARPQPAAGIDSR